MPPKSNDYRTATQEMAVTKTPTKMVTVTRTGTMIMLEVVGLGGCLLPIKDALLLSNEIMTAINK